MQMNMSHPTDEPEESVEGNDVIHDTSKTGRIVEDEKLSKFLKSHNLHKDLYQILVDNAIDMDTLQNDIEPAEIENICKDLNLKGMKKTRFNKLMRIINETAITPGAEAEEKYDSTDNDQDLKTFLEENNIQNSEKIYKILLSEKVTFDALEGITVNDIEKICDSHHIKIGAKIELKKVIVNHQRNIVKQKSKETEIKHDYTMKIVLIGESGAGKTALITRYCDNKFESAMMSTCGVDFMFNHLTLGNDSIIRLQIWDTGGQERYQSIACSYYRGAQAILFCYDVSNKNALDNCLKWRQQIEDYADEDVIVEFVACKCDLVKKRKIKPKHVDEIVKQKEWKKYDIKTVECSAKTGDNVNNVFRAAADLCMEKGKAQKVNDNTSSSTLKDMSQDKENEKKNCAC